MAEKFKWPCYKRKPHAPHGPLPCSIHSPYAALRCKNCEMCPGVRAHPLTMIGGAYAQEDIEA